jgi:fucose permease
MSSQSRKLNIGRYDFLNYITFASYAICSLVIPIVLVAVGKELNFPMDGGGMSRGGVLHLMRSAAMVAVLLMCGAIAARFGKRRVVGWAMILSGSGIILCAFSEYYWLLLPFMQIAGAGEGICEGLATPFVETLHPEDPERYVSISHAFWPVGTAISVLGAGKLLDMGVSWRTILFICGAGAFFIGLLYFIRRRGRANSFDILEKAHSGSSNVAIGKESGAILRSGRFWVYCFAMFIGAGSEFTLTFWAATYLQLNFNATPWQAGVGTAAIAAGMFVGRTLFGYFARERYLKHILLCSSLGTIPLTVLLAFIKPEVFPSQTAMYAALMVLLFLAGIGIAPYWPVLQVYGVKQLKEFDSTLLYIYYSAVGVPGCGLFSWLIGVLGDRYGLDGAFCMIPATLVVYALVILLEGWIFAKKR